jgi:hypothetical protein
MDETNSFTALETMIQQGWFWNQSERLEWLLKVLEEKRLITATEHQTLLKLAKPPSMDPKED